MEHPKRENPHSAPLGRRHEAVFASIGDDEVLWPGLDPDDDDETQEDGPEAKDGSRVLADQILALAEGAEFMIGGDTLARVREHLAAAYHELAPPEDSQPDRQPIQVMHTGDEELDRRNLGSAVAKSLEDPDHPSIQINTTAELDVTFEAAPDDPTRPDVDPITLTPDGKGEYDA